MSLPPGFLDELRTRLSIAQVVGRKVMWDTRKSNPGKGDMWAPCPFHQEKTASFHVDDQKGYYYCFGCHAKGDAISFVRETENVGFMEAIEILSREAGLPMPERDPQAQEKADRRTELAEVMEKAVQFFRLQIKTGAGAAARDYLAGRGLKEDALDRWEIGFAPPGWQNLSDHLRGKGVAEDLILDAGLVRPSDKGKQPYDTFRNRIMFPIRDARGRCIAFGGRAMDQEDSAKYLNSPETELFDKSRSLFNICNARTACGKGHALIVAEGYMDVIALSEAGFEGAVAPLGTAITEHQLAMLWRLSPEPVVMLDGDTAGQRAADRLIDLAITRLEGTNSLFFLDLPNGEDPDDFLKAHGRKALQARLDDHALPLVKKLWQAELTRRPVATPEQKADLDKRLRARIMSIPDKDVRRYYGDAIKEFRWQEFQPNNYAPEFKRRPEKPTNATPEARNSTLASNLDEAKLHLISDRIVAGIALRNPAMAIEFREGLEGFEAIDPSARTILDTVVSLADQIDPDNLSAEVEAAIGPEVIKRVIGDKLVMMQPAVRKNLPSDIVLHEITFHIALVSARRAVIAETLEAAEDVEDLASDVLTRRLFSATRGLDEALRGGAEDHAQYQTADNGVHLKREELGAFDDLLNKIDFAKGGRAH